MESDILDELIKELCPDGVEYKKISEVTTVVRGKRVVKKELSQSEGYPVYQNSLTIMGYYTDWNFPAGTTFVIGAGAAGEIGCSAESFWAADDCFPIPGNDTILDRFIFYTLLCRKEYLSSRVRKASIPRLSRNVITELVIPVPPFQVQEEIVKTLDKFIDYVTELQARKQQYEYYRDTLFAGNENIPMVELKKIATDIYRGAGIKRDELCENGIPCVRYGEIYTQYNTWFDECISHTTEDVVSNPKYFEHGDILFAITGESVEDIAKSVAYVATKSVWLAGIKSSKGDENGN